MGSHSPLMINPRILDLPDTLVTCSTSAAKWPGIALPPLPPVGSATCRWFTGLGLRHGLDDDALDILTSTKTHIYRYFLGVELRSEDLNGPAASPSGTPSSRGTLRRRAAHEQLQWIQRAAHPPTWGLSLHLGEYLARGGSKESGDICGKEKTRRLASRRVIDPTRRCQERLTSERPTRRCSPGWTCTNCGDHTLLQRARTGTKLHFTHEQWTASATASVNLTTHARTSRLWPLTRFSSLLQYEEKKLLRVIVVYDDHALVDRTCQKWFARFKSSNFDLEDDERPGALLKLDEDATQTQKELAKTLGVTQPAILLRLKEIGMIRGFGNWVPCELKPRDVECRFYVKNCSNVQKNNKERGFCIEL
ncbi:hypothetical protein LAZ67_12003579 [Cordylochernes scorpioides]|uniref:Mariner Mos1 transposase n=1 Tax=Cordylochernes scorpioides TaxID=51811 RepID=A0ABY6L2H2_9ARAC|nr:hypothetical protein LAZ67_12003579 [Cordylochernes scorpioides]